MYLTSQGRKDRGGMFLLCPRHFQWWVGRGAAYSITAVLTYIRPVCPVLPVCNKNGFHSISFEKISVLDSNFIPGI